MIYDKDIELEINTDKTKYAHMTGTRISQSL